MKLPQPKYIRWFSQIGLDDVSRVGGKNASLGEMYRELSSQGLRVPNGFAVTAEAFRYVLERAGAVPRLHEALDGLVVSDVDDLARRALKAREIVAGAALPPDLVDEIKAAYATLREEYGESPLCFASLFKDRAISYRIENGFDHFHVFLSVGVMKMVRSDRASSGVAFTLDTESGFRDVVFITGAYGLGENVVQGTVDPDEFYVFKPTLRLGKRVVLRRKLGGKEIRMVYAQAAGRDTTRNVPTAKEDQRRFCVGDEDVLALADAAVRIEDHYSRKAGRPMPMDIEWAKDGLDGQLYVVQARPETVASQQIRGHIDEYRLGAHEAALVTGRAVGNRVATGPVRVVSDLSQLSEFRPGEVLVADATMPDWGTVLKIAAAVVTNRGGRTCHAAIVAREQGIPAVVGCDDATPRLHSGDRVTVSCAEGVVGHVYPGEVAVTRT